MLQELLVNGLEVTMLVFVQELQLSFDGGVPVVLYGVVSSPGYEFRDEGPSVSKAILRVRIFL